MAALKEHAMIRAAVAIAILMSLACAPTIMAGKGTAWFYPGAPFADAEDYDYWVANNQRDWNVWPPFDAGQKRIAYYNPTSVQQTDNAILRAYRDNFRQYFLYDGATPVVDVVYGTIMLHFNDIQLAYDLAEWIEDYNGDWDGVYLDQTWEDMPGRFADSIAVYTAVDSATAQANYELYRDALIDRLRQISNDRYIIVANCGYPPLYNTNLSGITVESTHMTDQARIDETEAVMKMYLFPGSGFHNIAWEWSSYFAHAGTIE
jgi:hypothetical protein